MSPHTGRGAEQAEAAKRLLQRRAAILLSVHICELPCRKQAQDVIPGDDAAQSAVLQHRQLVHVFTAGGIKPARYAGTRR